MTATRRWLTGAACIAIIAATLTAVTGPVAADSTVECESEYSTTDPSPVACTAHAGDTISFSTPSGFWYASPTGVTTSWVASGNTWTVTIGDLSDPDTAGSFSFGNTGGWNATVTVSAGPKPKELEAVNPPFTEQTLPAAGVAFRLTDSWGGGNTHCLDVQWRNFTHLQKVWSYRCNGTPAQQWELVPVTGAASYRISPAGYPYDGTNYTGFCLVVKSGKLLIEDYSIVGTVCPVYALVASGDGWTFGAGAGYLNIGAHSSDIGWSSTRQVLYIDGRQAR